MTIKLKLYIRDLYLITNMVSGKNIADLEFKKQRLSTNNIRNIWTKLWKFV